VHVAGCRCMSLRFDVAFFQALQELTAVLNNAKYDDSSRLVLLTGTDTTFCSGVDLSYLTSGNIHLAARNMADTLR